MDINTIPKRRPGLIFQEIDGESLILDRKGEQIHQLNAAASIIWQNCEGAKSISDIAHILAENYEIDDDTALNDVLTTLCSFQEKSLLDE